jgi:hypothetical protein
VPLKSEDDEYAPSPEDEVDDLSWSARQRTNARKTRDVRCRDFFCNSVRIQRRQSGDEVIRPGQPRVRAVYTHGGIKHCDVM